MRKLATVQRVAEIREHDNADSLELAIINGWQVVVRKGEVQQGDLVIYFEIDSWVPHEIAPFLSKAQKPRTYQGVLGERLRTVKLRGQISQGLILPMGPRFSEFHPALEGTDLTELLGVLKWEPPAAGHLAGQIAGNFPHYIPKTDQERAQNCFQSMANLGTDVDWVVEEKLDGASCTIYVKFQKDVAAGYYEVGVASRNFDLQVTEENKDNTYVKTAVDSGYLEHMPKLGLSFAVQAELCGPGIQGNKYRLDRHALFVFDVFLIDEQRYLPYKERRKILGDLEKLGVSVTFVPFLDVLKIGPLTTCADLLKLAEAKSVLHPAQEREGIVLKTAETVDGKMYSFKAISNKFLLLDKE